MGKKEKALKILDDLIEKATNLEYEDYKTKENIEKQYKFVIEQLGIGVLIEESKKISKIHFGLLLYTGDEPKSMLIDAWNDGKDYLKKFLISTKETLNSFYIDGFQEKDDEKGSKEIYNNKIFIAHGQDIDFIHSIDRFLIKNNIETIILEEMASKGNTIIEKLEEHSKVKCVIILISPEDELIKNEKIIYRARQNVIWEFGFFAGLLSRSKVIAMKNELNRKDEKVEIELPSNIHGIVWIPYNKTKQDWKLSLSRELNAIGYEIDPTK